MEARVGDSLRNYVEIGLCDVSIKTESRAKNWVSTVELKAWSVPERVV